MKFFADKTLSQLYNFANFLRNFAISFFIRSKYDFRNSQQKLGPSGPIF